MFKEKKSVMKSVRMTEKVSSYIENFEGDGFNQKLENLVLFCMDNKNSIKKEIDEWNEHLELKRLQLRQSIGVLRHLTSIEIAVNELINVLDFELEENENE